MATIDMLTVANHAEAVNGLLYLSGAGWTNLTRTYLVGTPPNPHHFGIAVSVLVPWTEANQRLQLSIWLEHEDGGNPILNAQGELEVGRPPGTPQGSDLRAVLAIDATVDFPRAGGYRVVAEIAGQRSTYAFTVADQVGHSIAS